MRQVVILCGPPGAGKTTQAHMSGLTVYDRDDERWASEQHFARAIAALADDPNAKAVVIRSGATSSARTKWAQLTDATHVYVITAPPWICRQRVTQRGRHDVRSSIPAITQWFADHEPGAMAFPGWDAHHAGTLATSRAW